MTQNSAHQKTVPAIGAGDDAALAALRRERDEAVAAREAVLDMVASFTHELRTPLTGILGMTNLLLGTELSEDQSHYARTVWESGNHLRRLVDDVVELALLASEGFRLEPAPAVPGDVIRGVLDIFEPEAAKKKLGLFWQIACEFEDAFLIDAARLRQVLLNLVANAIRYTDQGSVRIDAAVERESADGLMAVFTIADTGIGMSDEVQASLFARFTRAGPPDRRGAGLGLAISRQIVELMGGRIEVESIPGQGSRFLITVPLVRSSAPVGAGVETESVELPVATASLDLLLAEDDDLNQMYFETLLRAGGHRVTVVGDGKKALDAVRERGFDAVLMDIQMPVMDGATATREIRKLPGDRGKIPVIALSGGVDRQGGTAFQDAGFTQFLTKPLENADLAKALTKATGRPVYIPDYSINTPNVPSPPEGAIRAVEAFLDDAGT